MWVDLQGPLNELHETTRVGTADRREREREGEGEGVGVHVVTW